MERIDSETLRVLVSSGAVRNVRIEKAGNDGWAVVLRLGTGEAVLKSRREPVRLWKRLDNLVPWLEKQGVGHVDLKIV